jgi:hypothetical protein
LSGNDLAEDFARLDALQTDVEVDGGLDIAVPFLNTYRTMCIAPAPPFRRVLEEIRAWV